MANKRRDLTNQKFNCLKCSESVGLDEKGRLLWRCLCDCGNEIIWLGTEITRKNTAKAKKDCGCGIYYKLNKHGNTTHGMKSTRLYRIWSGIKSRTLNKKDIHYIWYGERGITICHDWMIFENFQKWAIDNGYKDSLTLDRIDVDGNYEPNNCRWVDMKTQQNNKTNNKYLEINRDIKTLMQWVKFYGVVDYHTANRRINIYKWDIFDAVSTPSKINRKDGIK